MFEELCRWYLYDIFDNLLEFVTHYFLSKFILVSENTKNIIIELLLVITFSSKLKKQNKTNVFVFITMVHIH